MPSNFEALYLQNPMAFASQAFGLRLQELSFQSRRQRRPVRPFWLSDANQRSLPFFWPDSVLHCLVPFAAKLFVLAGASWGTGLSVHPAYHPGCLPLPKAITLWTRLRMALRGLAGDTLSSCGEVLIVRHPTISKAIFFLFGIIIPRLFHFNIKPGLSYFINVSEKRVRTP